MTALVAPTRPADDDIERALTIARGLVQAGVPLFVAPPHVDGECVPWCKGTSVSGFHLPRRWETSTPTLDVVNRWRPGWALCAVMGHRIDLLDVDPRNGGDTTVGGLKAAGAWPTSYGQAATPSGGTHDFIAALAVGSRDNIAPGVDVKGGRPDGDGRGFAFIAPTVRVSKTTGQPERYRWLIEPNLDELDDDDSGATIADMIQRARGNPTEATPAAPVSLPDGLTGPHNPHTGPIPDGTRHAALVSYAGHLRNLPGLTLAEAENLMRARWSDCAQPPAARYPVTWEEAHDKLTDVWYRYPTTSQQPSTLTPAAQLTAEAEAARLAQLTDNELVRLRARRAAEATLRAETAARLPPPDFVALPDLLAEPDEPVRYLVDELWPRHGRVMLVAQAKAGKTTLRDNLIRSLADGTPFLDRFHADPVQDGTIVVFDVELSRQNLRRWLADQTITNQRHVIVVPLRGAVSSFDLFDEQRRNEWVERIRSVSGRTVILDCLGPVLAAFGLDEKDNRDVGRFLVAFEALLKEADVTEALVVHHMGHNGERGRGASRLRDWPDAEWRLVRADEDRDNPDPARYLTAVGRDVELPETQLEFTAASRRLVVTGGGSRKEVKDARYLDLAVDYVTVNPGLSQTKIVAGLEEKHGVVRDDARAAIRYAVQIGAIRQEKVNNRDTAHYLEADRADRAEPRDRAVPQPRDRAYMEARGSVRSEQRSKNSDRAVATFAAPATTGCPCHRHTHSQGDWGTCPRCGSRYHRHGPGRLRQCPHCHGQGGRTP